MEFEACANEYYAGRVIDAADEPEIDDIDLAHVLGALADQGRLSCVRVLAAAPDLLTCAQVKDLSGLDVKDSTFSHHLKVLREAGLTHTRVGGTRRYLTLRRADLDARFPGLLDAVLGAERTVLDAEQIALAN
jgi:DNA-binding transcriptional ArsR family regulator